MNIIMGLITLIKILTEFGTELNTAQEAKLSAKYLARLIAETLNK